MYKYEIEMRDRAKAGGFNSVKEMLTHEYLRASGIRELATKYSVSPAGIHKILKRYGVAMKAPGGPNHL